MASLGDSKSDASVSSSGGFSLDSINISILNKFILVLEAAAILVFAYFIILFIKRKFENIEAKHEQQRTVLNLLEKICSGFTLVIGVTMALKTVGLDISLLVSVGVLGLSYGLKDVIKNYVAGILIFFKSPFKIGDIVQIKKYTGRVSGMDLQSSSLKTFDNKDITIYNSDIMTESITNFSRYPMRRMQIDVCVGYGTDIQKAVLIFDKILMSNVDVLKKPKYSVIFQDFTNISTVIRLKFWVNYPSNILKIKSDIAWEIHQSFDEASVYIPYSRAIESDSDYTFTPARQERLKAHYSKPAFSSPVMAPAPEVVSDQIPEYLDMDEPE
jgi:small-conductance mechanosensitive channel